MILTDAEVQARIDRGERYDGIVLGPNQHLAIDSSWPGSYGNHSCDPNLWMLDAVTIGTRRRVAAGEELTVDYAVFTATSGWSMPCRCGSRLCRGVVTGGDWRRSDLQARDRGPLRPVHRRADPAAIRPPRRPRSWVIQQARFERYRRGWVGVYWSRICRMSLPPLCLLSSRRCASAARSSG
jgi:hypothetical protein